MNKNSGFVSTTLILTIIMLVSAIVFLVVMKNDANKNLNNYVAKNVKITLASANKPNCSWENISNIEIDEEIIETITLTCTHLDDIATSIETEIPSNIDSYIKVTDSEKNETNNIEINNANINRIKQGYAIAFEIKANEIGKYNLILVENTICTTNGICNQEKISSIITVQER